jgi:short-subunit dehydrogenase
MIWIIYDKHIAPHVVLAMLFWFFMILGAFRLLRQAYRILAVGGYYCCKKRNVNTYKKYGKDVADQKSKSWAIVTGSSEGIGLGFCHELARRGFNIILLSRTKAKLEKAAKELEDAHGCATHIVVRDLSKMFTLEDYKGIVDEVPAELDVAMVVNNAGSGMPGPISVLEPTNNMQFEVTLNALHPVYHTKAWLDRLKKRHLRSGVINVASTMGQTPMVANGPYCMTKAFLSRVSQSVWYEFKHGQAGVDILDYRPAFVAT